MRKITAAVCAGVIAVGCMAGVTASAFNFEPVKGVDDEGVHMVVDRLYHIDVVLKPGEEWSSGWYSFGEWSYAVKLTLRKIEKTQNKSSK